MAEVVPPTDALSPEPRLPARIGALLADPVRALADIDARGGGGIRDATWLIVLGTVCFRLQDLIRAFQGLRDGSVLTTGRQVLMVFAQEVRGPVVLSIFAGLAITIIAGRGKRDPSTDIELGAACYVPFFAVRAVFRLLTLDALLGKPTVVANQIASGIALTWMLLAAGLAVRTARRRGGAAPKSTPGTLRDRLAVVALAAILGAAFFTDLGSFIRSPRTAPAFRLPRVDGQPGTVALEDFKDKVVLLDFWATWCGPCLQMMPTLHALYDEFHPRGVEFVGINSDGPMTTPAEVRAFLQKNPAPYPIVIDEDGAVGGRYNVVALPHMVVLGRDGHIRKVVWGVTSQGELAKALTRAAE